MRKYVLYLALMILTLSLSACGSASEEGAEERAVEETVYEPHIIYEAETPEPIEAPPEPEPPARLISEPRIAIVRDFSSDAALVLETVEGAHPIFVIDGMLPEYYGERRAEFLAATAEPMSRTDFVLAVQRFFTTFRTAHMSTHGLRDMSVTGVLQIFRDGGYIDERFELRGNRIFLYEEPGVEVIKIGGVAVADIIYQIDRYYFFDNDAARNLYVPGLVGYELMLRRAGATIYSVPHQVIFHTEAVDLTLLENGETVVREVRFPNASPAIAEMRENVDFIIRYEIIDDIFHIDLRSFTLGEHIDQAAEAIEQAIADGIWRFVIDLRSNGGGDSRVGTQLFAAMGINPARQGVVRRNSELAIQQWQARGINMESDQYIVEFQPWLYSENPNGVFLSVLTDTFSFSASPWFAAQVQDSGVGNVVGEPSGNSPTLFSDVLTVVLPDSQIQIRTPAALFMRPDANADQRTVVPDIPVPAREAPGAALEFLLGLER